MSSKAYGHYGCGAEALVIVADRFRQDFKVPLHKDAQWRHRIEPSFFVPVAKSWTIDLNARFGLRLRRTYESLFSLAQYWTRMGIDNSVYVPYPNSYNKMAYHTVN